VYVSKEEEKVAAETREVVQPGIFSFFRRARLFKKLVE
jgi:hypothetical protein